MEIENESEDNRRPNMNLFAASYTHGMRSQQGDHLHPSFILSEESKRNMQRRHEELVNKDPALVYKVDISDDENWQPPLIGTKNTRKSLLHRNDRDRPDGLSKSPSKVGRIQEQEQKKRFVEDVMLKSACSADPTQHEKIVAIE